MAEENSPPLAAETAPGKTAAEAVQEAPQDDKHGAASGVVHEAAHAAATVEAEAVVAAAAAQKEAAKLAEESGERAAKKWLEGKITEIENAANARLEELKKWVADELAKIDGKKPAGSETAPPAPASGEPAKKRFRRI